MKTILSFLLTFLLCLLANDHLYAQTGFNPTFCPTISSTAYGPAPITNQYTVHCSVTYQLITTGGSMFTLNHNVIPGTLVANYNGRNAYHHNVVLTENYLGYPFNTMYPDSISSTLNLLGSNTFAISTNTFAVPPNMNSMCIGGGFVGYDIGATSIASGDILEYIEIDYQTLDNPFTTPPCITINYSDLSHCSGTSCTTCSSVPCKLDSTFLTSSICTNYPFESATIYMPGNYHHTYTNSNGCDSLVSLHLIPNTSCPTDTNEHCWKEVACGHRNTLAIKTDGSLWAWGNNTYGESGLGTISATNVPMQIGTDHDWTAIEAGSRFSLALKSNGTLWAWGENTAGQLGDGTFVSKNTPVPVGTDNDWLALATFTGSFTDHCLAIKNNHTLWAWGNNSTGQLGLGNTNNTNVPTQVGTATNWKSAAVGNNLSLALNLSNQPYSCGYNSVGQLAVGVWDPSMPYSTIFLPCNTGNNVIKLACGAMNSYFINFTTQVSAAGHNVNGNYGNNNQLEFNSPTLAAGGVANWNDIKGSLASVIAIKNTTPLSAGTSGTQGTLWTWGSNLNGMLGTGDADYQDQWTPFQVGTDANWKKISGGGQHFAAINSLGELWLCGWNIFGEIGDGTNIERHAFKKISCLTLSNALPLSILSFRAQETSNKQVLLNWETANEIKFNVFEIERSEDGILFEKIGAVQNNHTHKYTFTDQNPLAKNYYRLKIMDHDGKFEYSNIEVVELNSDNDITLYPNPASTDLTIHCSMPSYTTCIVSIKNAIGQEVINTILDAKQLNQKINIASLRAGIYFIELKNKTNSKHLTFVKN